jgi:phage antirepressor YoqD-like protein
MNNLSLINESVMKIQDVATVLGVSAEAIRKHVRELYPDLMRNGIETYLNERQVTEIKRRMIPTTSVVGSVTALEIEEMTIKVISYHKAEADRLRAELIEAASKIESFNALMRSDETMSITDAAKHFGLHPKTEVFPYLRDRGYLTIYDLPTQSAIDAGYLALREVERRGDGKVIKQACVLTSQLETWRVRVVPQINAWKSVELK